ncbi:thiamine pyrophosphate-dependent dehydrogenase E1 component subunit alpha, partial [Persephonella sp.]
VGAHLPHAVGAAYARKYLGHSEGVLVAFGDGATNAGNYYESLNMAALWKVPVLFLNENNLYAIGTRVDRASAITELYRKAKEFMPAVRVDGMNFFEVYDAVSKAKEYMETEGKPYYIEALTYRYEPHSMSDPGDYRSPRELKVYHDKDPIEFLKKEGLKRGLLTEEFIKQVDLRVQQEIEEAVKFALESPEPEDSELYTDIFCEVCTDVVP